jgi:hypothetical protein
MAFMSLRRKTRARRYLQFSDWLLDTHPGSTCSFSCPRFLGKYLLDPAAKDSPEMAAELNMPWMVANLSLKIFPSSQWFPLS